MARLSEKLPDNVPGNFFVDRSCIDCDTCRQVAPEIFSPGPGHSVVQRQPEGAEATRRALMALVACPTASIGTAVKVDASAAARAFPELIEDEVYYCGYAAESSFGASSYLIRRPQGNVLVDSPRAARPLMKRIAELGGVRTMFLTHRDDVAYHRAFRAEFGCERVLHEGDVSSGTADVERRIQGYDAVSQGEDLLAIPVPGHTRGSMALLYRRRFLFTGDHIWGSEDDGRLSASRSVCWYSWSEQVRSIERLLEIDFEWVLPGHGRRYRAANAAEKRRELERLLARLVRAAGSARA